MRRSSRSSIIQGRTIDSNATSLSRVCPENHAGRLLTGTQSNLAGMASLFSTLRRSTRHHTSSSAWLDCQMGSALLVNVPLSAVSRVSTGMDTRLKSVDDYWNSGYGRIIMVPRVKLAYDKVGNQSTPSLVSS